MKNFVQNGTTLTLKAPAGGVTSGAVVVVNKLVGVAEADAAATEDVAVQISGVFELKKTAALAISAGEKVYFDTAAKEVNKTNTNPFLGLAVADAAGADASVKVLLDREGN